jgi:hypothetical protein
MAIYTKIESTYYHTHDPTENLRKMLSRLRFNVFTVPKHFQRPNRFSTTNTQTQSVTNGNRITIDIFKNMTARNIAAGTLIIGVSPAITFAAKTIIKNVTGINLENKEIRQNDYTFGSMIMSVMEELWRSPEVTKFMERQTENERKTRNR